MDIPSFTQACFINAFHQKNFFAAASCWLLREERKSRDTKIRQLVIKLHQQDKQNKRCLTCTWCSRRTGLIGWRQRLQNEPWTNRRAWEALQGTSRPFQQDSVHKNNHNRFSQINNNLCYKLLEVRPQTTWALRWTKCSTSLLTVWRCSLMSLKCWIVSYVPSPPALPWCWAEPICFSDSWKEFLQRQRENTPGVTEFTDRSPNRLCRNTLSWLLIPQKAKTIE